MLVCGISEPFLAFEQDQERVFAELAQVTVHDLPQTVSGWTKSA